MSDKKVRYAVVGIGWFAQEAVLPGFAGAKDAQLAAIVSGDPKKREELGKRYKVPAYDYPQYDELLASGDIDAVYIVLPNSMHKDYTVRAAKHKVHVLCEKPMAASVAEGREMIAACDDAGVKLMIAYRLHFESANLTAIEHIKGGKIGEPRLFDSVFTQQVAAGNSRLNADLASTPLRDVGIYCVNAARYLFQADPVEVTAFAASGSDPRFRAMPETVTATMRFPQERLATFTCGFGEASVSEYRVVGTTGRLEMQAGYTFRGDITMKLTDEKGKAKETTFPEKDQVGAELQYFAECVLNGREPEPNGLEGLADMTIIEAIEKSYKSGQAVKLGDFPTKPRPSLEQEYKLSKQSAPALVHAAPPSG